MEHIEVNRIPGLSAYRLSWIVARLTFERPNTRGELRKLPLKKAVLRVLCDRYPNAWAGVEDTAAKVSCSGRHAQDILHELEWNKLIHDMNMPPMISFRFCGVPPDRDVAAIRTSAKTGGRHCETVQYFVRDRKIVDWFVQWALLSEEATKEDERAA